MTSCFHLPSLTFNRDILHLGCDFGKHWEELKKFVNIFSIKISQLIFTILPAEEPSPFCRITRLSNKQTNSIGGHFLVAGIYPDMTSLVLSVENNPKSTQLWKYYSVSNIQLLLWSSFRIFSSLLWR